MVGHCVTLWLTGSSWYSNKLLVLFHFGIFNSVTEISFQILEMKRLNRVSLTAVTVLSRSFQLRKELYRNKLNRPKRKRKNYKTKSGKREKNSRKWRYSYATVINSSVYGKHGKNLRSKARPFGWLILAKDRKIINKKLEVRLLALGKDSGVWRLVEATVPRYSQRGWRVDSRDQR